MSDVDENIVLSCGGRCVVDVGVDGVLLELVVGSAISLLVGRQSAADLGQSSLDLVEMDRRLVELLGERGHLLLFLGDLGFECGHLGLVARHRRVLVAAG